MTNIWKPCTKSFGEADISGEELHEILREIDTNMNGQVELDEYLQVGGVKKNSQYPQYLHQQDRTNVPLYINCDIFVIYILVNVPSLFKH